ncbi:GNAT family N-acetyltransferase [Streptomyces ipomoeae]|uniref:GNAT family N-acetyltransferase n=1 Tax=Streptomyces ipomoeae TaxID=103232 RepID=UPI0029ACB02A|nr:GNAT family N-acetyltransferase [Streptomyces ipomoeae]MDX2819933.1 GNAT family N-acetyltransferase [Streptomyces ipomoeae]MDX2872621.1 GNAT family N-acetyltransferase [Streptomyces ipomoeae]
MTAPTGTVKLVRYGIDQLDAIRPTLVSLYAEVYAADIDKDPFFSIERFTERLAGHASRPSWEAVVAYDGGEAAGYAYASALPEHTGWWAHMLKPLADDDVHETGQRTLALFELMVRTPWRGTGLAQHIHEELLAGRTEERVTLLVDPEHPKVKALYESWGYRDIGGQQPFPDAPVYATMLRPLR